MAQIARLTKGSGPPAELGQYTLQSSAVGFIYTFSGTTYYAIIRSGPLGWVIVGGPSAVPETAVNAAFTALGAGARITLLDGTWPLAAAGMTFTANQQVLEGQGRSTFIDGDALATNVHAINLSGFDDCIIRNLSVQTQDGAGKTCHCIFIEDGADRFVIEHVIIVNSDEDGIRVEGTTIDTGRILHCIVLGADIIGINIDMDGGEYMNRLHIEGCDVRNCGQNGIRLATCLGNRYCDVVNNIVSSSVAIHGIVVNTTYYSRVQGNISLLNAFNGIQIATSRYVHVIGNICYSNIHHGIQIVSADYCTVENNTCVENDSGDTGTYDGINVDGDSTRNNILGNICVGNHRRGIHIDGEGNSANSNIAAENDRHGISISAPSKVNDNLCYNNGADNDNSFNGIILGVDADRSTVNGNTCYSDGVRQQDGISLSSGANNCIMNDNLCYNNATDGISLAANNDDCMVTGNHCLSNGIYGIRIAAITCNRNRVKDNILRLNGTAPFLDAGTDTQLETIPIPLIQGTAFVSAAAQAWGWEINLATEFALGIGWLPWETQQVVRIQIKGVALAAPGAGNNMRLEITGDGGTFDEGFATEPIDVANHNSEEDSFAIGDVVSWVVDAGDDADIGDLLGGDRLQVKLLHEAAGNGDIATDVIIDTVQVEIV